MDHGPNASRPAALPPTDAAAPARAWRPAWGYLVLAAATVGGAVAWAALTGPSTPPARLAAAPLERPSSTALPAAVPPERSTPPATAAVTHAPPPPPSVRPASAAPPSVVQQIPRLRDAGGDQTPDVADFVNPGERATMPEVIERLRQAGVTGGLAAFSPPGTRPPRIGLAVPEDFVLPEGYVRHHQATDDGQRIEPILMFSPNHAFFDAAGRPVEVPPDRVVPPELAPPGLPLRRIVVPPPTAPERPGR